ncbi:hypothetical protein [Thermogemmatispora tikiterensis]|uniref:Uncharacterized protein n=1 Tax=Thermogemmatispora tikiterensis TaxID=1825093 RepID=A0A328VM05_9CHLR|nr:hypothetical protein [Thermogemmatispora tikiterensis]RAQ98457.1 hypothetical protein A4R35_23145 [Thermogemmatispora tikiterensis]
MTLLSTSLRRRAFGLRWLAALISLMSTWLLLIGLPLAVYRRRASMLATGALFLATALPDVLLGPLVGVGSRSLGAPADVAGSLALLLPRAGGQVSAAESESTMRSPLAVGSSISMPTAGLAEGDGVCVSLPCVLRSGSGFVGQRAGAGGRRWSVAGRVGAGVAPLC